MESADLKAQRLRLSDEATAIGASIQPIADRITALEGKLATGMSAEEQATEAAALSGTGDALQTAADALTALGATAPAPTPAP